MKKTVNKIIGIGTEFYEVDNFNSLKKVSSNEVESRLGKNFIDHIERFNGFANVPSFQDHKQVINNYWNLSKKSKFQNEKIEVTAKNIINLADTCLTVISDICNSESEFSLVMDWLATLIQHPTKKIPMLCLFQKESPAGISSFLHLLEMLFEKNIEFIQKYHLDSKYNNVFASKQLAVLEEIDFSKGFTFEKIFSLLSTREINFRQKNCENYLIPCNLHFVGTLKFDDETFDDLNSKERFICLQPKPIKIPFNDLKIKLKEEIKFLFIFLKNKELKLKNTRFNF